MSNPAPTTTPNDKKKMNMKTNISIIALALLCWACEENLPPQNIPEGISATVTNITESTATCVVTLHSLGATQRVGVIYGAEATLQSGIAEVSTTDIAGGNVTLSLTGLTKENYYFKAYAADSLNTYMYSEVGQFKMIAFLNTSVPSISASFLAGSYTFSIASNTAWSISSDQGWCTVQPTSGEGSQEISVSVTNHTSTTSRTATLTIKSNTLSKQISLQQDDASTEFGNGITAATTFDGGDGTQASPYLIATPQQLKKLVNDVNFANKSYSGAYFLLTANIFVTANEWIPIGSDGTYFRGSFDGGGHTINGSLRSDQYQNFGFFGVINGCSVSNLTIAATVSNETNPDASNSTGGITGSSYDGSISNCHVSGAVAGVGSAGGVAGYAGGVVQDCTVSGDVSSSSNTGGVVGMFAGDMTNCVVSGKVTGKGYSTGGIVGTNLASITNCTVSASGVVIGDGDENVRTGGIVGENGASNQFAQISDCTNYAAVTGSGYTGGIAGINLWTIHTSLNTGAISGPSVITGGLVGRSSIQGQSHVYSCNTNTGNVNNIAAHDGNQFGNNYYNGAITPCHDNHEKRK